MNTKKTFPLLGKVGVAIAATLAFSLLPILTMKHHNWLSWLNKVNCLLLINVYQKTR